ncbi:L7Ae/L30e/S12e/Gadd45 family ribosomal protein [Tepidibacter formicigenes]|jgi:ribosomal protein L7Ae-like RNA K-turn-binding protein|uniref:Ribosomal protein L7Ae n=1 Tax=Tepidibacter formicigenes DSM 15518 TaxID=1123349 RepID=A0A1M6JCL1_9FIRM|nr:ribosomal L7Ae/L30e/S12e/Gadd45 family protein [Tepidibacter formicigenes]SHJ44403.1 Ribosomal protein L7Ae [Tepidibacter formicigenes DSM 15518]
MKNKILSLLGLALKSGNLVSGDDTTLKELKKNKIKLVVIAQDASDNTKKLFIDKSRFRNVEYALFATKEELGKSIGKSSRAVIGIKDKNFANKIKELIGGEAFVKDKSL